MGIYLIKRCPRPEHHRAPYSPVIVCDRKDMAKWEVGSSSDNAWLWEYCGPHRCQRGNYGWMLQRWNGLDIDYGHICHRIIMPDGYEAGIDHRHQEAFSALFKGAVWWSENPIRQWLSDMGVVYPFDHWTQQSILNHILMLNADKQRTGYATGTWPTPDFWPVPADRPADYEQNIKFTAGMNGFARGASSLMSNAMKRVAVTKVGDTSVVNVLQGESA